MKFITTIIIISIIGFFGFMIDTKTAPEDLYSLCEGHFPVLLLHHIIWIFTISGWLSYNVYVLYFYIFTLIAHMVLWAIFNNECILTNYTNDKCKTKIKLRTAFLLIKEKLNLNKTRYLDIVIYSLFLGYAGYKLIYKKNLTYSSF
jgi:hypothetical protein